MCIFFLFILVPSSIFNNFCCKCCRGNDELKYIDKTNEIYSKYLNKVNLEEYKGGFDVLKKFLKEVKNTISNADNGTIKYGHGCDEGFYLKYIDYESISKIDGLDIDDINELKNQVRFINMISSIYLLEFLFRLFKEEGRDINFMLTVNGAGGPVLQSAGFVNLIVGEYLCSKDCSMELDFSHLRSKTLDKGAKGIFTSVPIFDNKTNKIYTNSPSSLSFFNGKYFDTGDRNNNLILINFYMLCEYLAQLGNPLFAICDGYEFCVASIYNALQLLSKFLDIPFCNSRGGGVLEIFNFKRSGDVVKLDDDAVFRKIKDLGAVGEIDMKLLAEVIVLNNLLFCVYKFANQYSKNVISNLAFSSYGGRVFEMLMSIIKNEYRNFSTNVFKEEVFVKKDSLTAVFIHGLIGDNKIKKSEKDRLFFNNENLFKAFAGGVISRDRLKYFSCEGIFGNSLSSIFEFYNSKVNSNKVNQIISKFRRKGNYSLLKNLVRWDIDEAIYSFYDGEFNDGMLSSDGLFIYDNSLDRVKVNSIIGSKIDNSSSENKFIGENVTEEKKINVKSQSGFYIIEGKNIRYIHVGGGTHICVDNEKDSYEMYENRGEFLKGVLKILYERPNIV